MTHGPCEAHLLLTSISPDVEVETHLFSLQEQTVTHEHGIGIDHKRTSYILQQLIFDDDYSVRLSIDSLTKKLMRFVQLSRMLRHLYSLLQLPITETDVIELLGLLPDEQFLSDPIPTWLLKGAGGLWLE